MSGPDLGSLPQRTQRAVVLGVVELDLGELAGLLAAASHYSIEPDLEPQDELLLDLWRLLLVCDRYRAEAARQYALEHGSTSSFLAINEVFTINRQDH